MTTPVLGEWIQFDLGTAKVISTYGVGNGGSEKEIGNWTLAGSTDNSTWYTIDTQTEPTPAHYSFDTYATSGPAAASSFRYIRFIVQGLRQQPYIMGTTLQFVLYLRDSGANFLLTSPVNTGTFSQNLGNTTGYFYLSTSLSDVWTTNIPGAGPSQPGYYYGTNNTYTGTVSTSITSGAPLVYTLGGLYIKVVLPSSTGLGSYEFNTPSGNTVPDHIAIYGNNDGSTSTYLVNDQASASNAVITTSNNAKYSTYYIVVNSLTSGTYANISYIRFYNTTGGAITPSSVTMSSGWGSLNLATGGSISDPIWLFSGTSSNWIYMNVGTYYNGPFINGSFNNALTVLPGNGVIPGTLYGNYWSFTLSSASAIGSYGLGTYHPDMTIYGWYLLGSSDNSSWNVIDSKTTTAGYNSAYTTNFTLASPSTAYQYIRLVITAIHNNNNADIWLYRGGFWIKNISEQFLTSSIGSTSSEFANPYGTPYLATTASTGSVGPNLYAGYNQSGYLSTNALNTLYSGPGFTYIGTVSSPTFLPPSAPPAPTALSASAGNGSASISFTQASDGGEAITNYKYSLNGGTFTAFDPEVTTSPVVIGGLTNGVVYTIQLKGVNSLGDGTASASITVTPATIPDAPTNLVATYDGSGAVSISFTPGSNGGSTITNYQYSIDCGASFTPLDPVDGITPVRIEGLTNGQAYCIELKAVNSVDAGIASSSVQYTPYGPADAPTNLTWVDTLNGTISLSFTPGSNQGSAITNYEYSLDGGNTFAPFSPAQTTSPVSISGLNIRTHYSIVLRAVNDAGGEESAVLIMYYLCFLEGTKILCFNPETKEEEYRAIETLRKGSLVKTVDDGYKAVDTIGTSKIYNPGNSVRSKNRLYKCSKENYPSLTEDLFITGCHSILVKDISEEERAELMDYQGKIYITDNHYRLIAAVDKRAEPHASEGVFNIWHMALENDNYYFNYGIYANGLLVETSSLRMMKEFSGMDLVQ
jgi:hypothetical protein